MLYYGFDEQARHEHMSDEYKDRYIIIALLKNPPRYYIQYREHLELTYQTEQEGALVKHNLLRIYQTRIVDRLLKLP